MIVPPPRPTLFPYTTLFRSRPWSFLRRWVSCPADPLLCPSHSLRPRSEEHTSELQSQFHLVCRLLLVKKKTHRDTKTIDHPTFRLSDLGLANRLECLAFWAV